MIATEAGRFKRLGVTAEFIVNIASRNDRPVTVKLAEGLPEGTRCVSSHGDGSTNLMTIVVENESFPVIEPGQTIPWVGVRFDEWGGDPESADVQHWDWRGDEA